MLENKNNVTQEVGASNAPVCSPEIMDYDPNLTLCGHMAKQVVRLTFGIWKYRAEKVVEIGGNCTGFRVIEAALREAYDQLDFTEYLGREFARIELTNGEDTLESEDDEYDGEQWLADMLIGAEIISIAPKIAEKN